MKTIGNFLNKKNLGQRRMVVDQQSAFYIFQLVLKEEYGRQGRENIIPIFFKDKKIFIKVKESAWTSVIWPNRNYIIRKINEQLGGEEILELVMTD